MFTGIIETVGRVAGVSRVPGGTKVRIEAAAYAAPIGVGESVAVDGVCLTATASGRGWFEAEISPETGRRSTLGDLRAPRRVNLERPLQATAHLGGHFVQGHVDAIGAVAGSRRKGGFVETTFRFPASLKGYLVEKGSVAVNGVSLTVAALTRTTFTVALIPHTLDATNLGALRTGSAVNLEVDILAKYVRAALARRGHEP